MGGSFTEGGTSSPAQQDESTLTDQEEEYAHLMEVIQADFGEGAVVESNEKDPGVRCNVYVSSQTPPQGKARVRFNFHAENHQDASIPATNISLEHQKARRSPLKLNSILCNGADDTPTSGCVALDGSKKYETHLEDTTNALSAAIEQLTFGDDVIDVFESSQNDMNKMMDEVTTETEKSIESCRSLSRKLSGAGGQLIQIVSADTKSLSENFAGSIQNRSCDVNKLKEVVADHWHKGYFNTDKAVDLALDKSAAAPPSMSQSTLNTLQDGQCDPSKQVFEFLHSVSTMVTDATKAVQHVANTCDDQTQRTKTDNIPTSSETPLNRSWFSVEQDADSISKLTNPHDLSTTLNNISLDLTAIPKIEEKDDQLCEFLEAPSIHQIAANAIKDAKSNCSELQVSTQQTSCLGLSYKGRTVVSRAKGNNCDKICQKQWMSCDFAHATVPTAINNEAVPDGGRDTAPEP